MKWSVGKYIKSTKLYYAIQSSCNSIEQDNLAKGEGSVSDKEGERMFNGCFKLSPTSHSLQNTILVWDDCQICVPYPFFSQFLEFSRDKITICHMKLRRVFKFEIKHIKITMQIMLPYLEWTRSIIWWLYSNIKALVHRVSACHYFTLCT